MRSLRTGMLAFVFAAAAAARIPPRPAPDLDVETAADVVAAKWQGVRRYEVTEAFYGSIEPGRVLEIEVHNPEPRPGEAALPQPGPGATVLLFLSPKGDLLARRGAVLIANTERELADLRSAAKRATALRRDWDRVQAVKDLVARRDALWPWVGKLPFGSQAMDQLVALGPIVGDLLALRLEAMTHGQRMVWLPRAGEFHSEVLRAALLRRLSTLQASGASRVPRSSQRDDDPARAEEESEHSGLLAGIQSARDRRDLPALRESAIWVAEHGYWQSVEPIYRAFRLSPDHDNLPAFDALAKAMRKAHSSHSGDTALCHALDSHKYPDVIELVAPLLEDAEGEVREHAMGLLHSITGLKLGLTPGPWLEWAHHHPWRKAWTPEEEPDWQKVHPDLAGLYSAWLNERLADAPNPAWTPPQLKKFPGKVAVEVRTTGERAKVEALGVQPFRTLIPNEFDAWAPIEKLPGLTRLPNVKLLLLDHASYY